MGSLFSHNKRITSQLRDLMNVDHGLRIVGWHVFNGEIQKVWVLEPYVSEKKKKKAAY